MHVFEANFQVNMATKSENKQKHKAYFISNIHTSLTIHYLITSNTGNTYILTFFILLIPAILTFFIELLD